MIAVEVAPMTEAEKAALVEANFAHFVESLHFADQPTLDHEADRMGCQRPSPLVKRMRAQIAAEQTARRAHQLLVDLGDNADAIADRLRALGIKGAQCLANICPLAVYLDTHGITAYISAKTIIVPIDGETATVRLPVPPGVAVFVERVDGGVYLDLIDAELNGER